MSIANTTIRLKKSLVSGNTPITLDSGELAINAADDKLFFAKPGGTISYITNQQSFATINANSSLVLASSVTDTLTLIPGNNISISACTSTKTITITSTATGGGGGTLDQFARDTANSASSNTIYTQGVDATQNTNITNLQTWLDANIAYLSGVDSSQNTNIVNANTQLKSYVDGQISYVSSINTTQNNSIQSAWNTANNALPLTGGVVSGDITANNLTANLAVYTPILYSPGGTSSIEMSDIGIIGINPSGGSGAGPKFIGKTIEVNSVYSGSYGGNFLSLNNETKLGSSRYDLVQIVTGTDGSINNTWSFANSHLIFPDNTWQNTAFTDAYVTQINSNKANTIYTQGVDATQNTRLNTVEANTVYLFGALNQTNTNIVSANTQLKAYSDGAIASANTQLKGYVDGQVSYIETINNTQNTNITTVTNLAQGAYDTANTKFNTSGGNITGTVTISSNLTITGNLTVAGNVTTVSANNLIITDNMIYLNDGNQVTNPDLGFAGNYNDGTYRHTGFFRDASDGYWKVYDQYLPEPDASPYIDTSNSSFRIADFQANNVTLGKITTSSTQLVTNLNAQYLNGQQGSYYAVASEQSGINATQNTNITNTQTWLDANIAYLSGVNVAQNSSIVSANTQLKSYTDGVIDSANTQLKAYVDVFISYVSGVDTTQNTNITSATNLAQASYNQANTANINAANASFLTTGTVSTARLGSGTANSTTFLRGDGTWGIATAPLASSVRQSFTASNNQTTFTIAGGYAPPYVDVFLNGTKLLNGTDVDVSSGTNIILTLPAIANSIVDVVGLNQTSVTVNAALTSSRISYTATAGQTVFTTPTYVIGLNQVRLYINGVRQYTSDYTETSTTSITLSSGCTSGDSILIEVDGYNSALFNSANTSVARQSFTASNNQTSFTVSGGYLPGNIDVYYNGSKLLNGTDVTTTSGTNVVLSAGANTGAIIDVVGLTAAANYVDTLKRGGDTMSGDLAVPNLTISGQVKGYLSANNGLYSYNNFTGTYTGGIVVDYVTGNGRISVGTQDGLIIYNGGLANNSLITVLSSGNTGIGNTNPGSKLTVGGTIESTSGGIKYPDGSTQTSAGATTGKAIAMSIVFGG